MLKKVLEQFSQGINSWAWLIIVVGTITWSLTMVKSGLVYSYGMGFWGPNGHDGIWHISLAQGLANGSLASGQDGFRPGWQMPVFSGEVIKNYHVGFDLILAGLHKLTFIPIRTLYFQIIPPILAFLIGYFVYKFVYVWKRSKYQAFWATFFVYFGGSWGWVLSLFREGVLDGESMFWSQQSISTIINPPFALSILLIFLGLYLLVRGLRDKDMPASRHSKRLLGVVTFLFGILIQIKVYAGILILVGLFAAGIWRMLKRQGISLIKLATGVSIISILLFSPVTRDVDKTLVFKPFWFLETMMLFPDRLGWIKFGEAMINYKLAGNWIKGIPAYAVAFIIFWFGNLGTRILKEPLIFGWLKRWKNLNYLEVFFASVITVGIVIPMFFVQTGTPWNTIQFMYYSLMFSGVLAGVWLGGRLENVQRSNYNSMIYHTRSTLLVGIIVLLTIPTTIGSLGHFLPSRPPAKISHEELEALEFLRKQSDGVVLTQPFDIDMARAAIDNPPRPLYLYESTAYVSAFSGKSVYLEDEVNLEITGYGWRERRAKADNFFGKPYKSFLLENQIRYVYVVGNRTQIDLSYVGLETIFENVEITIFKII